MGPWKNHSPHFPVSKQNQVLPKPTQSVLRPPHHCGFCIAFSKSIPSMPSFQEQEHYPMKRTTAELILYNERTSIGIYVAQTTVISAKKRQLLEGGGADASLLVHQPTHLTARFPSPKKQNHVWGFLFNSTSTLCMMTAQRSRNARKAFSPHLLVGDSWGQSPMLVILQQLHSFLQATLQTKQQHEAGLCTEIFHWRQQI